MFVLEYKVYPKQYQIDAINEAIKTTQFVRNKVLRFWMDNRSVGKTEMFRYNTRLRKEYNFVTYWLLISLILVLFMISIGGDLPKLGITAAIVGTFTFVCVSAFDCMNDFKANVDDMDDEERPRRRDASIAYGNFMGTPN